jgi:hypothetical protein
VSITDHKVVILDQVGLERAIDFEGSYLHMAGSPAWLRHQKSRPPGKAAAPAIKP